MPRLLNIWKLDDSYDDASYDDCIPVLLNICELNDSSDYEIDDESNECDNIKNNGYCSDKRLEYSEDLSEEDNYDENLTTDDEMSDLIG